MTERAPEPETMRRSAEPGTDRPAATSDRPTSGEHGREAGKATEPCLRCGVPISRRLMGCKGGHCPNCAYPYPHGDCSD